MTTTDALKQYAPILIQSPEFQGSPALLYQIQAATRQYAEEKAKHFAGWIANQVIAGRTYDKLWRDYLNEHPLE
ncbi:hypothetical protein [Haliscomenobacter hydrossis]|uniref:Uncharacterized protein n=1 Tax=Haliscomenobacter hydrossis (strain ATCC 27775 / DSM 1100 / LMG 10767 / O) TaxID=760192 RepID=F4L076_HALH1|nr:hypothetical protein [Haliscomenobacter hydrossis]AEE53749.1 hypothetical protein Halhy_5926 [Haliscomenobacter hydrossis DSM 1100]